MLRLCLIYSVAHIKQNESRPRLHFSCLVSFLRFQKKKPIRKPIRFALFCFIWLEYKHSDCVYVICVYACECVFIFCKFSLGSLDMVINSFCFHLVYGISSLHSLSRAHTRTHARTIFWWVHIIILHITFSVFYGQTCSAIPSVFSPISFSLSRAFSSSVNSIAPVRFYYAVYNADKTLKTIMLFVYVIFLHCRSMFNNCELRFFSLLHSNQINVSNWYLCVFYFDWLTPVTQTYYRLKRKKSSSDKCNESWTIAELISIGSKCLETNPKWNSNAEAVSANTNNKWYYIL